MITPLISVVDATFFLFYDDFICKFTPIYFIVKGNDQMDS